MVRWPGGLGANWHPQPVFSSFRNGPQLYAHRTLETSLGFGAASLVLAFAFAGLVERFTRLDPEDLKAPAPAAFAVTSVALLSFALAVSLDAGLMPVAFSLTALGIAWIYTQRPLPVSWLAIASGVLAGIALYASVPFPGEVIGKLPFFNKLILLVGLPAAALIAAGEIIRRHGREFEAAIATAIGLAALALFTSLEIRHWLNDGTIATKRHGTGRSGNAVAGCACLLGRAAARGTANLRQHLQPCFACCRCDQRMLIAFGLLLLRNPFFDDGSVGARPFLQPAAACLSHDKPCQRCRGTLCATGVPARSRFLSRHWQDCCYLPSSRSRCAMPSRATIWHFGGRPRTRNSGPILPPGC
ncbi:MAG: DUF2339 domain-containing protein [Nitratireductor sp.]